MKIMTRRKTLIFGLIVTAVLVLGLSPSAFADGTAAGEDITNRATIGYQVGGNDQTPIESSPTGNSTPGSGNGSDTTFLVDNKIDLTVAEADSDYTSVSPNEQNAVLTFTVTNDGNSVQDFVLSAADGSDPHGGTDNFNAANVEIYVEDGITAGYQSGEDTATYIDELAADATVTVYVVADIPIGQSNGDISAITLTATTHDGGASGSQGAETTDDSGSADDPASVQVVFGDAAGDTDAAEDGQHSDTDAYLVGAPQLTITKTSEVISDPFSGTTNPKSIPGAIVEYTITVENDGAAGATASSIAVSDSLNTEITNGTLAFETDTYGAGSGIQVTAPNINGGSALALSNADDADEGDFGGTAANTVTVTGIELDPGESATVNFRVEVQ